MKTSMQELIDKLNSLGDIMLELKDVKRRDAYLRAAMEAQSLLKKERQQIIDAFNQGYREGESCGELNEMIPSDVSKFEDAKLYFKNTYES